MYRLFFVYTGNTKRIEITPSLKTYTEKIFFQSGYKDIDKSFLKQIAIITDDNADYTEYENHKIKIRRVGFVYNRFIRFFRRVFELPILYLYRGLISKEVIDTYRNIKIKAVNNGILNRRKKALR